MGGLGVAAAPANWPKNPLAYVEWYSAPTLTTSNAAIHNMYSVKKAFRPSDQTPLWSIIPLTNVRQSCMLYPNFKRCPVEEDWTTGNILDKADEFLISNWLNLYTYRTVW